MKTGPRAIQHFVANNKHKYIYFRFILQQITSIFAKAMVAPKISLV